MKTSWWNGNGPLIQTENNKSYLMRYKCVAEIPLYTKVMVCITFITIWDHFVHTQQAVAHLGNADIFPDNFRWGEKGEVSTQSGVSVDGQLNAHQIQVQ